MWMTRLVYHLGIQQEAMQLRRYLYAAAAAAHELSHNTEEAVQDYVQSIYADPTQEYRYTQLINLLVEHQQYPKAIEIIDQMSRQPTMVYDACLWRGDVLKKQDKGPAAEGVYRNAIIIEPGRPEAYKTLAELLAEREQIDEAAAVYQNMARQPDPWLL